MSDFALMLDANKGVSSEFRRIELATNKNGYDEKWLQNLLFEHCELIPIQEFITGTKGFAPLCREFPIRSSTKNIFLDLLGVTAEGQLVLMECKLWRNPQARREVIAQILEYASLINRLSYADLTALINKKLNTKQVNPIFNLVQEKFPDTQEAWFVDNVINSLKRGKFLLLVIGDGIRSDIHAIAEHLNRSSGLTSELGLVEIQLWENPEDQIVVIPSVPVKTKIIENRILISTDGQPIMVDEAEDSLNEIVDDVPSPFKVKTREFWEKFINSVSFNHSDQPAVTHGGHGWVRLAMPKPVNWITAFRARTGEAGFFIRLKGDDGHFVYEAIEASKEQLDEECQLISKLLIQSENPFEALVKYNYPSDPFLEDEFMSWLLENANRLTLVYRPFLNGLELI